MLTDWNSRSRSSRSCLLILVLILAGCIDTSQQEYDQAVDRVNREQGRLDNLRPAYDAARQTAMQAVIAEKMGGAPQPAGQSALDQLNAIAEQAKATSSGEQKGDALDQAVDQLTAMQDVIQNMQTALGAAAGAANPAAEVIAKINTPGTPENKRYEELLAAMPEVQAYERQKARLEEATKSLLAAEAKLPDAVKPKAANAP